MGFLDRWRGKKRDRARSSRERGILVFSHTSEVIRAEELLKQQGFPIKVMGPPPKIRSGCDLVVEFPLIEELNILRHLREKGVPLQEVVPVSDHLLKPVDLFAITDFGDHLMIRAANMKLTAHKESMVIVNVSGGGCPDVPYLAREMIDRPLLEAPQPRDIGHTLCGYALHLAYEEMVRRCSQ